MCAYVHVVEAIKQCTFAYINCDYVCACVYVDVWMCACVHVCMWMWMCACVHISLYTASTASGGHPLPNAVEEKGKQS